MSEYQEEDESLAKRRKMDTEPHPARDPAIVLTDLLPENRREILVRLRFEHDRARFSLTCKLFWAEYPRPVIPPLVHHWANEHKWPRAHGFSVLLLLEFHRIAPWMAFDVCTPSIVSPLCYLTSWRDRVAITFLPTFWSVECEVASYRFRMIERELEGRRDVSWEHVLHAQDPAVYTLCNGTCFDEGLAWFHIIFALKILRDLKDRPSRTSANGTYPTNIPTDFTPFFNELWLLRRHVVRSEWTIVTCHNTLDLMPFHQQLVAYTVRDMRELPGGNENPYYLRNVVRLYEHDELGCALVYYNMTAKQFQLKAVIPMVSFPGISRFMSSVSGGADRDAGTVLFLRPLTRAEEMRIDRVRKGKQAMIEGDGFRH